MSRERKLTLLGYAILEFVERYRNEVHYPRRCDSDQKNLQNVFERNNNAMKSIQKYSVKGFHQTEIFGQNPITYRTEFALPR